MAEIEFKVQDGTVTAFGAALGTAPVAKADEVGTTVEIIETAATDEVAPKTKPVAPTRLETGAV